MCKPASFVLTKDRVFWSIWSDSHEEIIREHSLVESTAGRVNILRVEVTPPNCDFKAPLEKWAYRVDQDLRPKWHDKEDDEKRAREELKKWFETRVILSGSREIKEGNLLALGDSQVTARDSSQVTAMDRSQVTARDSSQVTARDRSQITAMDRSQVTARDSSQVTALGDSQVTARDSSQVTAMDRSQVTARDSSQVTARDSSQVTARDSSQVTEVNGTPTVSIWDSAKAAKPIGAMAVVIDRTGEKIKVIKGK
jgi:hypothetical protein